MKFHERHKFSRNLSHFGQLNISDQQPSFEQSLVESVDRIIPSVQLNPFSHLISPYTTQPLIASISSESHLSFIHPLYRAQQPDLQTSYNCRKNYFDWVAATNQGF